MNAELKYENWREIVQVGLITNKNKNIKNKVKNKK
jgi:hypothetical protein